jgi:hypothetical protein
MLCASHIAGDLGKRFLEAIDAPRAIWRIALLVPGSEAAVSPFIGLATEWGDDPDSRS